MTDKYGDARVKVWNTVNVHSGSENTNIQLLHGGWWSSEKLEITKIMVTDNSGLPCVVKIWDQDLSSVVNEQTLIRGSSTHPLLSIGVGTTDSSGLGAITKIISSEELPKIEFNAGICMQVTQQGVDIIVEARRY